MSPTIGSYLIDRLLREGARHVFGVPGDFVLGFFRDLERSPLRVINTADEQGAGFAADAYARLNGFGVVVVTYGVGGLKVANTTAEAYAEMSPVLVISGAPGVRERGGDALLHHRIREFDTQRRVFDELTVASAELSDAVTAAREIERVLAAIRRHRRPGYLELPRDMLSAAIDPSAGQGEWPAAEPARSDPGALQEALAEAAERLNAAKRPLLLVGEETHRLGLGNEAIALAEQARLPIAVSIAGKSAVPETHPQYIGVYAGQMADPAVRDYVEGSDGLLVVGMMMTEFNLGIYSARLDPSRAIHVESDCVTIGRHTYHGVTAADFMAGLLRAELQPEVDGGAPRHPEPAATFRPEPNRAITATRLFEQIDAFIDCNTVLISDVGDALFGALDVTTCRAAQFLSPSNYASLGFAVPAAIAAQLTNPDVRPLVLVGDGAFQMTGMELSTAARFGLSPIVVVLNNAGYATERPMIDGKFNDITPWRYDRLPEVLGHGRGFAVDTEEDLHAALKAAREYTEGFAIIDVHLGREDFSPTLQRLTAELGKKQ